MNKKYSNELVLLANSVVGLETSSENSKLLKELGKLLDVTEHVTNGIMQGMNQNQKSQNDIWFEGMSNYQFAEQNLENPTSTRLLTKSLKELGKLKRKG